MSLDIECRVKLYHASQGNLKTLAEVLPPLSMRSFLMQLED